MFQHTAARRRLANILRAFDGHTMVSTHSRPKAAGKSDKNLNHYHKVSTHSRPKAAG